MNCQNLPVIRSLLTIVMLVVNIVVVIISFFLGLNIYPDYFLPFFTKLVSIIGGRRVPVRR